MFICAKRLFWLARFANSEITQPPKTRRPNLNGYRFASFASVAIGTPYIGKRSKVDGDKHLLGVISHGRDFEKVQSIFPQRGHRNEKSAMAHTSRADQLYRHGVGHCGVFGHFLRRDRFGHFPIAAPHYGMTDRRLGKKVSRKDYRLNGKELVCHPHLLRIWK